MTSNETSIVGAAGAPCGAAACALDLFILHATADTAFVRGYLLPALDLPASRVLLLDDLALGAIAVSEIERGVVNSRLTVVVVSGACRDDDWAVFGEQLATHRSVRDVHVVPLRLDTVRSRSGSRRALPSTSPIALAGTSRRRGFAPCWRSRRPPARRSHVRTQGFARSAPRRQRCSSAATVSLPTSSPASTAASARST